MSNVEWTLSQELCKLTETETLPEALSKLNIIRLPTTVFSLREDSSWLRGGAETYIFRFWVKIDNLEKGFIIKACVTLTNIEQTILEWVRRRKLIETEGIFVPKLLFYGGGILIEELVPFSLREILTSHSDKNTSAILKELTRYVAILARLGFSPIDAISDLRSHGTDVVVIDFGEDLGPPFASHEISYRLFDAMINVVQGWGVKVPTEKRTVLKRHFFMLIKQK